MGLTDWSKLSLPRVLPNRLEPGMKIKDLVELYRTSGSFQAGRIAQGCLIYKRMIEEKAGIALTLAGAMAPTGMGIAIARMIEHGAIDWIISTGANIFHDLHFALDLPLFQGDPKANDAELKEAGIDRIYDIFLAEDVIKKTDSFIFEALKESCGKRMGSAELHYILGKALLDKGVDPKKSFVATAAKYNVPVYTPAPGDSEIGMALGVMRMMEKEITLDPIADVIETTAIVHHFERNGVIIVGGGSPKNFFLQTQPMLKAGLGIDKKGHDYDIQITVDGPQWGGLSGATPEEAVSWGKVNPTELKNSVVIYSDSTIVLPIIFGYVLELTAHSEHKQIYLRRKEFIKDMLKKANCSLFIAED